jgi:hypothetical protein
LVSAVNSSLSGLAGLGPNGSGARSPVSQTDRDKIESVLSQNGVGFDARSSGRQNSTTLSGLVSGAFAAQAFAQETAAASEQTPLFRSPSSAAAAYQSASNKFDRRSATDVEVPGQPSRLLSGRLLDFKT